MITREDYENNKESVIKALTKVCAYLKEDIAKTESENEISKLVVSVNLGDIQGLGKDDRLIISSKKIRFSSSLYGYGDYDDVEIFISSTLEGKFYAFHNEPEMMAIVANWKDFKELYTVEKQEEVARKVYEKRLHDDEINRVLNFEL